MSEDVTGADVGAEQEQQGDAPPSEAPATRSSATIAKVKEEPLTPPKGSSSEAIPAGTEPAEAVVKSEPDVTPEERAEQAQLPPAGEGGEGQAQVECGEQSQPVAESAEAANTPAEGAEAVKVPAVEGSDAAQPPAEGAEAIQAPGDDAGTAPPPGEGAEAAGDAADGEEKVPALVKVVHSARSVFRQRDQKEYDPFTAHLERRITKLFEALDTEGTGRVDVHELGTLIRSVGCCPSESDLQEMVTQLEEEGQPGLIRLETVMPYIIQCVEDRKYPSATAEQLLQAFEVLAEEQEGLEEIVRGPSGPAKKEKKEEDEGTIPQDKLVHILTEEGEHFSQEEVEEMLSVVSASDSARVDYTEFVKQLVVPELW